MNRGMFYFPERFRDESLHGFPKKKVSGESFFGFPSARGDFDIKYYNSSPNQARSIALAGSGTITIDWGDGSTQLVSLAGLAGYNHIYTQPGYYNLLLLGDTLNITQLIITTGGVYSVRRDFSRFKSLTLIRIDRSDLSSIPCEIPDLSQLNVLESVQLSNSGYFGVFPMFTTSSLKSVILTSSKLTGSIASLGLSLGLTTVDISDNRLTDGIEVLSTLIYLVTLNLYQNSFAGTFPSLLLCSNLQQVSCHTNYFSGLCPTFNGFANLVSLALHNNAFSGNIPSLIDCPKLEVFTAGGVFNVWNGIVPYFPPSLKVFSLNGSSSSNLEFPYDIFDNLLNLNYIGLTRVIIGGNRIFPNISNNINLGTLYLTDNLNIETKFNGGAIVFNTSKLTWFYSKNMDGVALDLTNLQMLPNSSYFIFTSASVGNIEYPLGSKIIGAAGMYIELIDNGMSLSNVDMTIINLFIGRNNFGNTANKNLFIGGIGTYGVVNAAPSGTYQQPAGFTHDLTEAQIDALTTTVKEKIWILVNCQVSSVDTTKRYKWTITTN